MWYHGINVLPWVGEYATKYLRTCHEFFMEQRFFSIWMGTFDITSECLVDFKILSNHLWCTAYAKICNLIDLEMISEMSINSPNNWLQGESDYCRGLILHSFDSKRPSADQRIICSTWFYGRRWLAGWPTICRTELKGGSRPNESNNLRSQRRNNIFYQRVVIDGRLVWIIFWNLHGFG